MADQLNLSPSMGGLKSFVGVFRTGESIFISFDAHLEDDVGFLPRNYSGRVINGHTIEATFVIGTHGAFFTPYVGWHCYDYWEKIDGRLNATISPDDGSIAGTVEDTFRHPPTQAVFTVKTSFQTPPP